MAQSRAIAVLDVFATALIALVASLLLAESKPETEGLYCVKPDNGHFITTLNASLPRASCFRTQNGGFIEVLAEVPKVEESTKEEITWLDGYVLPGIIESHGHILQYGEMLESVSLYDSKSIEEMRERIKAFLMEHKGEGYGLRGKWVRGIGWDQKYFGGVMPTSVRILSLSRFCMGLRLMGATGRA